MSKFTSEDLMKAMGLSVGDRIKWKDKTYTIFQLCKSYFLDANENCWINVIQLIDEDYDILPRPKRVGDLKCGECSCITCQLRGIGCRNISTNTKNTLYEILDKYFEEYPDQEIHDLLKARLDKEVK